MSRTDRARRTALVFGIVALAAVLGGTSAALAETPWWPPIPTPEQREMWIKGGKPFVMPPVEKTAQQREAFAAQDDYDVTKYFLDLDFTPSSRTVAGSVTMTATSTIDGLTQVVLDFYDNMTVSSVKRGTTSLAFARGGNLLTITLDRPFAKNESFEIITTYTGVPTSIGFGSIGWNKYAYGGGGNMVWTLSEPEGARTWWPCKDRPDDKAMVEEWWAVPSTYTATGNGLLQGTETRPNGHKRYKWKCSHPLTSYLVSIAATVYTKLTDTYTKQAGGTMPIEHYVYNEDATDGRESFKPTPLMITEFARLFGEYPFVEDKYGHSAFPWGGAMEHTTNTSYGYFMIDGGHGNDWIIAHELAHQWWGDSISPREWKDVWLNEGFASYCEAAWAEHLNGAQGYHDYMMSSFWHAHFDGPLYDNADEFGTTVYSKGAWALHMLRGVMGDTAFYNGMRAQYATYKDGFVDTPGYQATMEQYHGGSLQWFFDEWVYGQNSPAYEWGWSTANRNDGTFRTYVRIHQVQTDAGTFTMPVRLTLVLPGGNQVFTVWNDTADQDFTLDSSAAPTDVRFDENDWILKASTTKITLADADGDGVPDRNDVCPGAADAPQTDADHDLHGAACECNDADPTTWAPPGEAAGLGVALDRVTFVWTAPAALGGTAVAYDLLRSPVPSDFGAPATCVATGTALTHATDAAVPAPGSAFHYLARARNSCGGTLGSASNGTERPGRGCP